MFIEPWFTDLYELQLIPEFSYFRYTEVNHASSQLKTPSNNYLFSVDLGATATEYFSADVEVEFLNTPQHPFNFLSGAVQGRFQWMDDVVGDPVSLVTGISVRGVPHFWLTDLSCPYHGEINTELSIATGREWSQGPYWRFHLFGYGALGIANIGAPWSRLIGSFQTNWRDTHELNLFANGYFGFGGIHEIHPKHFHGYSSIHHQSIDLGAGYSFLFTLWGKLSLDYAYRVFARSYPERVNTLTLSYQLPFSPF